LLLHYAQPYSFITYSENGELSNTLRDMKSFTAKQLIKAISENPQESRKEWMLNQFKYYGSISPQKQEMQFWKHDNHPFFLYSNNKCYLAILTFLVRAPLSEYT
jgi:putative transposase